MFICETTEKAQIRLQKLEMRGKKQGKNEMFSVTNI